jgi:hypothetical protein
MLSLFFIYGGNTFSNERSIDVPEFKGGNRGLDFRYSDPEMFFTEPGVLKLSVVWEILNCFTWEYDRPVDQCFNLEFYVVNETGFGDQVFISQLEGTGCLTDGCEGIIRLPLVALLTPDEYIKHELGIRIIKHLRLHLAFGGEEDEFGRVVGRKIAKPYYDLKYILNGTGFGSVSVIRMERVNGGAPLELE